jgi:hypothetical protein
MAEKVQPSFKQPMATISQNEARRIAQAILDRPPREQDVANGAFQDELADLASWVLAMNITDYIPPGYHRPNDRNKK